ncbi:uncharacterized protein LTR77_010839 [Saxophila tyrrhenica]|uniref:Uncharacterized protein n=1 Tax=Saxophila tyrrhenica TaxID=1690608 RepID=A0AAV9NY47_9PEZI|nr:hypothetical protein LTR77_010839 [Saxophila tyrrhenica]
MARPEENFLSIGGATPRKYYDRLMAFAPADAAGQVVEETRAAPSSRSSLEDLERAWAAIDLDLEKQATTPLLINFEEETSKEPSAPAPQNPQATQRGREIYNRWLIAIHGPWILAVFILWFRYSDLVPTADFCTDAGPAAIQAVLYGALWLFCTWFFIQGFLVFERASPNVSWVHLAIPLFLIGRGVARWGYVKLGICS